VRVCYSLCLRCPLLPCGISAELFDSIVSPNEYVYAAMIDAYAYHTKPKLARKIFSDMVKSGIKPTSISYSALLRSHVHDPEATLRIWDEMEQLNFLTPRDWQIRMLLAVNSNDPDEIRKAHQLLISQPGMPRDC
jgi:pentatricopeptide repeat protein